MQAGGVTPARDQDAPSGRNSGRASVGCPLEGLGLQGGFSTPAPEYEGLRSHE